MLLTVGASGLWLSQGPSGAANAEVPASLLREQNRVACAIAPPADLQLHCYRVDVTGAELSVAVFSRAEVMASEPPLVYLAGGPGVGHNTGEMMLSVWAQWYERLGLQQHFVLIDPRGVKPSHPSWDCRSYLAAAREQWKRDLTYAQEAAESNPRLSTCFGDLAHALSAADPEASVAQLNSRQYAADLASVLLSLGYSQWDLLGVSYGTRVALTAALHQPQVRRVILDSPYPLNRGESSDTPRLWFEAFERYFTACDQGLWNCPAQAQSERLFWQTFERLEQEPLTVTVEDWARLRPHSWLLNGERLAAVIYSAFYSSDLYSAIYPALKGLSEGSAEEAGYLLELFYNQAFDSSFNNMVFWATECNDNRPEPAEDYAGTLAEIGRFGALFTSDLQTDICVNDVFTRGQKPEMQTLDVPVLVVVGEWDPITPAGDAHDLLEWLPQGLYLPLIDRAHAEFGMSDCGAALIPWFLDAQAHTLEQQWAQWDKEC